MIDLAKKYANVEFRHAAALWNAAKHPHNLGGAAVLLLSEDLDEILELADRVAVMSEGAINYGAPVSETDRATI